MKTDVRDWPLQQAIHLSALQFIDTLGSIDAVDLEFSYGRARREWTSFIRREPVRSQRLSGSKDGIEYNMWTVLYVIIYSGSLGTSD